MSLQFGSPSSAGGDPRFGPRLKKVDGTLPTALAWTGSHRPGALLMVSGVYLIMTSDMLEPVNDKYAAEAIMVEFAARGS